MKFSFERFFVLIFMQVLPIEVSAALPGTEKQFNSNLG